MREAKFAHEELKELVEEKKDLVTKGRKISEEIEEKQSELKKLGMKVQKVKDKVIPLVEEEIEGELDLGEFEEINSIDLDGDEIVVRVIDRVEDFKNQYREEKKKQEEENEEEENDVE